MEETLGEPEAGRVGEEGAMILVEESGDSGCRQRAAALDAHELLTNCWDVTGLAVGGRGALAQEDMLELP